jgi:8-oxo-dGTP diphosphatase
MCMVYTDGGDFLVEDRQKLDWPGLTFPGGHVQKDETIEHSVVREIKEETGLDVTDLQEVGVYEWNEPKEGVRHVAALYRTNKFSGVLTGSVEGRVFWIQPKDIKNHKLSTDMDKLIAIMRRGVF